MWDFITIFNQKYKINKTNKTNKSVEYIIPTSKNIYELSKIIIPITNGCKSENNSKIKTIQIDKRFSTILKINKLNIENLSKTNEDSMCSICLQSDLSIIKTQCKHIFCTSCYLNHVTIKQKENHTIGCALCRQNLQSTKINLYKKI